MTTEKKVELANQFIHQYNVTDEDLQQELYLVALSEGSDITTDALMIQMYHHLGMYYASRKERRKAEIPSQTVTSVGYNRIKIGEVREVDMDIVDLILHTVTGR